MALKDVVQREIKRFYKNPLAWSIVFFIPFSMCLIICMIFSQGSPKELPIAVLDEDSSQISRMFVRNLNALPSCKVEYKITNFREGQKLLTDGKVYGFVAIPRNFQNDIYRLKQPALMFYYNGQRILIGGIISKDITLLANSMMVGMDATMRSKRGLPMDVAIKQANLIRVNDHVRSNPYLNYQYFLSIVAFGHILQIHLILASLWALGTEFKYGTSKAWLKAADDSIIVAYFGKMLPYFLIFVFMFAVLYFLYFVILDAPYSGNILIGFVANLMFIVSCMSLPPIFMTIGRGSFRFALSNAAIYVAMGFAFAGVTFPVMAMPLLAKIYSASLPLSYYIQVMINQSLRNIPSVYDLKCLTAMLLLMNLGLFFLPVIKKFAKDESMWFKL